MQKSVTTNHLTHAHTSHIEEIEIACEKLEQMRVFEDGHVEVTIKDNQDVSVHFWMTKLSTSK